jgi:N-formylmaleamate deformylase
MNIAPRIALLLSLTLLATSIATAEDAAPFSVKVSGAGSPALIFIPGLTCSGEVWDATVEHFAATNECHVLTLAGMGGQPPIPAPWMDTIRDAVLAYVRDNGLEKPVVVGHSIGGSLAFAIGSKAEPGELGGVVAVDGLPRLAELMMPGAPKERIDAIAVQVRTQIGAASPEVFEEQNRASLGAMISREEDREFVLEGSSKSDPKSVGLAMSELMMADLRDDIARMEAPALLIAAAGFAKTPEARAALEKNYRDQVAMAPNCETVLALNALHFVFLDDPDFFLKTLEDFLANRAAKPGDEDAAEAP